MSKDDILKRAMELILGLGDDSVVTEVKPVKYLVTVDTQTEHMRSATTYLVEID